MNRYDRARWVTWALILLLLIGNITTIYLLVSDKGEISNRIRNSVSEEISKIVIPVPRDGKDAEPVTEEDLKRLLAGQVVAYFAAHPVKDGKDGESIIGPKPVEGIDYFVRDGYIPVKDVDYFDGYTPVKNVDYFDGQDAPLYQHRCNTQKNRWEYKYSNTTTWSIEADQDGKPVKCTIGVVRE